MSNKGDAARARSKEEHYAELILDHQNLKRQYDELQTNFHRLLTFKWKQFLEEYDKLDEFYWQNKDLEVK